MANERGERVRPEEERGERLSEEEEGDCQTGTEGID
jgi:hypothetical protein